MAKRNIVVIGASAGGFDSLKKLVSGLPPDLEASIFIVWHLAPDMFGILPDVLNKCGTLTASNAVDGEQILPGHIYVAPPDRHLLLYEDRVRVTRGPKENLFRPAVDPLFRSAAYSYGDRVIGIILSGALDDGTAGLWTIKNRGGVAIVQDPQEAQMASMPKSAIREVDVDHIVRVEEIGQLIAKLASEEVSGTRKNGIIDDESLTAKEIGVAAGDNAFASGLMEFGELSPFTCPECHGVLSRFTNDTRSRYRCHTGHAYSAESLLFAVTESIEDSLYNALRGMEENVMLLNHIGDHFAEMNNPKAAAQYFKRAKDTMGKITIIRKAIFARPEGPESFSTPGPNSHMN